MSKKTKKAQTEIIGVAVIVIILVIAGFFMVKMRLDKKKFSASTFTDPKMAQSTLNALMSTKTERNVIISDIIKDCYSNRKDLCAVDNIKDCCEYAEIAVGNALQATLGNWSKSYRFTVTRANDKRINDISPNSKCGDFSSEKQSGFHYIPPPPPIVIKMEICG